MPNKPLTIIAELLRRKGGTNGVITDEMQRLCRNICLGLRQLKTEIFGGLLSKLMSLVLLTRSSSES